METSSSAIAAPFSVWLFTDCLDREIAGNVPSPSPGNWENLVNSTERTPQKTGTELGKRRSRGPYRSFAGDKSGQGGQW